MNSIEIPEKKIFKEYPSCWDEMNEEQFDFVFQQVLKLMDGKISVLDFKILVLYHFLDIKKSPLDRFRDRFKKKTDLEERNACLYKLSETLNWFFIEKEIKGEIQLVFNFDSVRNFIPKLDVWNDTFYGPDDALMNISIGEFRAAIEYFRQYTEEKAEVTLDHLVAVLYRPERDNYPDVLMKEDFDGQRRVKFNHNHTTRYAKAVRDIPFYLKYAIYLWFGNCNNFLREGEIQIEGNQICLGDLYKKQSDEEKSEDTLGWTGLLFRIADEGTFGNMKETDATNIYDVMLKLYQWKKEADAAKKLQDDRSKSL